MLCSMIDEVAWAKLMNPPQALYLRSVNDAPLLLAHTDEAVHRISKGFTQLERVF